MHLKYRGTTGNKNVFFKKVESFHSLLDVSEWS